MNGFSIAFLGPVEQRNQPPGTKLGTIKIGNFEERFESSVEFWSEARYQAQWSEAIGRLCLTAPKSCLITSMTDPVNANFLFWWPMYLIGQDVHLQNQVLLLSELKGAFDPDNPYPHIPERSIISDDGEPISEWTVALKELVVVKNSLASIADPLLISQSPVRH